MLMGMSRNVENITVSAWIFRPRYLLLYLFEMFREVVLHSLLIAMSSELSLDCANFRTGSTENVLNLMLSLKSARVLSPKIILDKCLTNDNIAEQDLLLISP